MNENKPNADAHALRRRRVLRGAISAPIVLTISSGASATMTSNLRCVANQVNNPTALPRTFGAGPGVPATVIRVPIYRITSGSTTTHYISGTEIRRLAHTSRPVSWIGDGQWRTFVPSTNTMGTSNLGDPGHKQTTDMFATVQINQDGFIIAVGRENSTHTSMIGATCWNSFRAGVG